MRFLAAAALLFAGSSAGTIVLCRSMSGGMPMPGGWTMSMAWMRMPGQSWLGAGAMFMLMWVTMMVAMMLPSLAPNLRHRPERRWLVAAAYFLVWTIFGAAAYIIGMA
jgi:predicted metal-binding membrane protein